MEWKNITKEELKTLIDNGTYDGIGKMFGINGNSVKKKAKRFGVWERRKVYTGHNGSLKKIKYCLWCGDNLNTSKKDWCNSVCFQEYNYHIYINKWKMGLEDGGKGYGKHTGISSYVRKYIFEKYSSKCVECGWSKVNPHSNRIPLEIDHIDGDTKNSKEENLILLCPNCHSLTPTHGFLNRGNGRTENGRQK